MTNIPLDPRSIEAEAKHELSLEKFREDVDKYKIFLKTKKTLLQRLFPFKVEIKRID